jgi:hypothetical protein
LHGYSAGFLIMRDSDTIGLTFAIAAFAGLTQSALAGPNDLPTYPDLGRYGNFFSSLCGKHGVDENPAAIPEIGCFAIKAGGSLDGKINDRAVSIHLDANGNETFFVDGVEIKRAGASATNDALIKPTGAGFAFCTKETPADCPVHIDTMIRQPGEFASFDVAREVRPRVFVTTQENWDVEKARTSPPPPR